MRSEIAGRRRGRPRGRIGTLRFAGRAARKVAVTTLGVAIAAIGIALLVLPGPGLLVVGVGLGILSTEYRWPARLSRWLRSEAATVWQRARQRHHARPR